MVINLLRGRNLRRMFPAAVLGALAGLSLLSTQALALSAGRIDVSSYLNEPFRATVPLSSLQSGEFEQLRVQLADDNAFANLGLEKSRFLTTLKFNLREGSEPGTAEVLISSREVAKEPFFGLMLEFRGLGGRLIREYTILLDPNTGQRQQQRAPVTVSPPPVAAAPTPSAVPAARPTPAAPAPRARPAAAQPSQPVAAPQPRTTAPAARPAAVPVQPFQGGDKERKVAVPSPEVFEGNQARITAPVAVAPQSESAAATATASSSVNQYGPVPAGMTLWQIAEQVRPNNDLSMNQVMWGLYSSNEDQFDGNLNLVRRGAMLRVPSAQAIRNVSPGEAAALVADQAEQHNDRLARIRAQARASAGTKPAPAETEQVQLEAVATAPPARRPQVQPKPASEPDESSRDGDMPQSAMVKEPAEPPIKAVEEAEEQALPSLPTDDQAAADSGQGASEYEELEALPLDDTDAGNDYADLPPLPQDEADTQGASFDDNGMESGEEESPAQDDGAAGAADEGGGLLGWLLAGLGILLVAVLAMFGLRRRGQSDDNAPVSDYPSAAAAASDLGRDTSNVVTRPMPQFDADDTTDMGTDPSGTENYASNDDDMDLDIPDFDTLADNSQVDEPDFGDTAVFDVGANDQVMAADQEVDFGDTEIRPTVSDAQLDSEGPATLDMPDDEAADDLDGGTQTLDLGSETVSLELNEDPLSEADFQLAYGLYDEAALLLNRAIENDPDRLELHEKLAETYFASSDADKFKQAAQTFKGKNPDADSWQRITIMGQQLCPGDDLFADGFDADSGGSVDLDMDFDGGDVASDSDDSMSLDFDMPETDTVDSAADAEDAHVLEFDMDEGEAEEPSPAMTPSPDSASKPASTSVDADDDFDADFGSLTMDADGDEELPDLDDLDLGDLESELDADGDSSADATLSGDTVATQDASDSSDEPASEDDFADLTLSDISDTELGLDTQTGDAGDVLGVGTDFDLEDVSADSSDAEMTDFELDSLGSDDDNSDSDLQLDDLELDSETSGAATDFDLDDLGGDDSSSETDFDLDSLSLDDDDAQGTDFDLDSLSLDDDDLDSGPNAGNETDFDLDNPVGELPPETPAEETDFELDDLGSETDFNLDDDTGADASDISGGDEAGTKLDLARAYVDMGENDMARSLLDEVQQAGNDAQKAEAQELLGKL